MSWQGYIDSSLLGTGTVDNAAIFDATGRAVWAASPGFQIKPEEMQVVVAILGEGSAPGKAVENAHANGIHLQGNRYITVKTEGRSIYGRLGKQGIVIVKTKQAILVAHQPETVGLTQTANVVEGLADYLSNLGF